jgi:hypothetical protein
MIGKTIFFNQKIIVITVIIIQASQNMHLLNKLYALMLQLLVFIMVKHIIKSPFF